MSLGVTDLIGVLVMWFTLIALAVFMFIFYIKKQRIAKAKEDAFTSVLDKEDKLLICQYKDAIYVNDFEVFGYDRRKKDKKTK